MVQRLCLFVYALELKHEDLAGDLNNLNQKEIQWDNCFLSTTYYGDILILYNNKKKQLIPLKKKTNK